MAHLPILPILVPLLAAAVILLVERRGVVAQRIVATLGMAGLLSAALLLAVAADADGTLVYLVGDWPARLGIALVADRLGALMVLATALLAIPCLLYAASGWDRRALHFHALFQLQLAGLNGAFLTGDLFNLFVFFEVLLIASYGLLLSGGRGPRMRAGLHYVAFNITASTLFLVALALLYGMTGTLNMAEMALRVADAPEGDRALLQAASGILLVVFCGKAALLPMYVWLPKTYKYAPAAVAALFTVMTKVGVYAVLRVFSLVFGAQAGPMAGWAWDWLLPLGLVTLLLGTLGAMAALTLRAMVAWLVIASAATLFVAFALATPEAVGAGLYYLVHSTFATAALFLVADLVRRQRGGARDRIDLAARLPQAPLLGTLLLVGAIAVTGLPPLSGFMGKFTLLAAVPESEVGRVWSVLLLTSLMAIVALARAGSMLFWEGPALAARVGANGNGEAAGGDADDNGDAPGPGDLATPVSTRAQPLQLVAVGLLLAYGVGLSIFADPVLRYARDAAAHALDPAVLVEAVRGSRSVLRAPSP
ncbi:monovalent cation/H+ antiporter subunit D [Luteimonas pelagia]